MNMNRVIAFHPAVAAAILLVAAFSGQAQALPPALEGVARPSPLSAFVIQPTRSLERRLKVSRIPPIFSNSTPAKPYSMRRFHRPC